MKTVAPGTFRQPRTRVHVTGSLRQQDTYKEAGMCSKALRITNIRHNEHCLKSKLVLIN
jgi:hypothetical protein